MMNHGIGGRGRLFVGGIIHASCNDIEEIVLLAFKILQNPQKLFNRLLSLFCARDACSYYLAKGLFREHQS